MVVLCMSRLQGKLQHVAQLSERDVGVRAHGKTCLDYSVFNPLLYEEPVSLMTG